MPVTYLLLILGGDYFIMGYELPNPGEILKELRKKENYTQEYVARQLGVEVKTYRSWEIGYYKNNIQLFPTINSDKLIKIADLYNVSIDYILGRSSITQVDNTYIHSKIGLSENSIITLEKAKKDQFTVYSSYIIEIIDFFLNHNETKELIKNLYYYFFGDFHKTLENDDSISLVDKYNRGISIECSKLYTIFLSSIINLLPQIKASLIDGNPLYTNYGKHQPTIEELKNTIMLYSQFEKQDLETIKEFTSHNLPCESFKENLSEHRRIILNAKELLFQLYGLKEGETNETT